MAKKSGKTAASRGSKKQVSSQAAAVKKAPSATKKSVSVPQSRRLKPSRSKRFSLRRGPKHPIKLPKARLITKEAVVTLWQHRRLFAGLSLIYGILNLILVRGLSTGVNVSGLKSAFNHSFGGHPNPVITGVGTFINLLGSSGNSAAQASSSYQLFLLLFASLAIIWALRQVMAGVLIRPRDAYYRGMSPLIPFILVLLVVGLEIIPLSVGAGLYSLVIGNGIVVSLGEYIVWGAVFALLTGWSLYMLSSSLFALYIVALPDMTPLKALRSAREIVQHRRLIVLRKIVWLPILLLVVAAIIMVPIIIVLAPLAQWVYLLLGMFVPVAVHTYMYTLYRELLREE
jgi:hypothetical protein